MKHSTRTTGERDCVESDEHLRNIGRRLDGGRRWPKERVAASVDQRMDGHERIVEIDEMLRATARRLAREALGAA